MQLKKFLIVLVISLLVFSQYNSNVFAEGVGVVPGLIHMNDCLKGEKYFRQITIFNSGEEPILFDLYGNGSFESWINFYKFENRSVPINNITIHYEQRIIIAFNIPENISNGEYKGSIHVKTNRGKKIESGATVNVLFPVKVTIDVTGKQILTGEVSEIKTKDVEVSYPLIINFNFFNTGNVIATPIIKVNITREGFPIDNFIYSDTDVEVNDGKKISVDWDTNNYEPGVYNAHVTILLDEYVIEEKNLLFELFPRGTFTRRGELVNLTYLGDVSKGNIIKILAEFQNTGLVETNAKFIGEIYRNNGLVQPIESDENPSVDVRTTYIFSTYFKIDESGKYDIKGWIQYANNRTEIKNITFNVEDTLPMNISQIVAIASFLLVFIALVFRMKRKVNKRK